MAHDRIELLQEIMAFRTDDPAKGEWFAPVSRALAGTTAAQAAWVPGEGMNSIWQLVNHLTFWTRFVTRRLQGERPTGVKFDGTFGSPGDPTDDQGWQRAVAMLREAYDDLSAAVAGQTDTDLERLLTTRQTRAVALISGSVMHDAYHIGQIVLLRKLQGAWS